MLARTVSPLLPLLLPLVPKSTVRLVEIADILGVSHQRTSVIVRQPGFPKPIGVKVRVAPGIGARSRRGRGSGGARSRGANRPRWA
jgi:hypothetical protein